MNKNDGQSGATSSLRSFLLSPNHSTFGAAERCAEEKGCANRTFWRDGDGAVRAQARPQH